MSFTLSLNKTSSWAKVTNGPRAKQDTFPFLKMLLVEGERGQRAYSAVTGVTMQ